MIKDKETDLKKNSIMKENVKEYKETIKMTKQEEYTYKVLDVLNSLFEEDTVNFISMKELSEGDNGTDFMHVMSNIVPTRIYNELTRDNVGNLEHNHIANRLCFQNSEIV